MGGSVADILAFMEKQQHTMFEREAGLRQEMEGKLEQLRQQVKPPTISEEQLGALQSRLDALHEARLLTDEELHAVEDSIGDCIEAMADDMPSTHGAVNTVAKMLALSQNMRADGAFARQLRRKLRA